MLELHTFSRYAQFPFKNVQFPVGEIRRIRFEENCSVDAYLNIVSH